MPTTPPVRITVLTCTDHRSDLLEQTLCSVLDQGVDDLELLVVDNSGDEAGHPLLEAYRDEITWSCCARGLSSGAALNLALERATGSVIAVVPAGVLLLPGALQHAAEALASTTGGWAVGSVLRLDEHEAVVGRQTAAQPAGLSSFLMRDGGHLPWAGTFYTRAALDAAGPFDPQLALAVGFDINARCLATAGAPILLGGLVSTERDMLSPQSPEAVLQLGREMIAVAEKLAGALELAERYQVWRNCDERRRIYALAEAETRLGGARQHLWHQLLRHPWWLASDSYRHCLLNGIAHPVPRKAA